jgi:hypothetical protein
VEIGSDGWQPWTAASSVEAALAAKMSNPNKIGRQ